MNLTNKGRLALKRMRNNKSIGIWVCSVAIFVFVVSFFSVSIYAASVDSATLGGVPFTKYFKKAGTYSPNDHGYVYYGSFPQTEITKDSNSEVYDVLSKLKSTDFPNGGTYEYKGERYFKKSKLGTDHYYIFEPIKWQIIAINNTSGSEKLVLLSEAAIDACSWDTQKDNRRFWDGSSGITGTSNVIPALRLYLNSYDTSLSSYYYNSSAVEKSTSELKVTDYSNKTFYEQGFFMKAFSEKERSSFYKENNLKLVTTINQSTLAQNYDGSGKCEDYVRILSRFEMFDSADPTNDSYGTKLGFASGYLDKGLSTNRIGFATDYVLNTVGGSDSYTGYDTVKRKSVYTWTRTVSLKTGAHVIGENGSTSGYATYSTVYGIRPVISINPALLLSDIAGTGSIDDPYRLKSYKIHYDANGGKYAGSYAMDDTKGLYKNDNFTLPNAKFQRNGYTFGGWGIQQTEGTTFASGSTVVIGTDCTDTNGVITLYAHWNPISYSLSYELNGGTVATANPASYTCESETFTLNNPAKAGYTFTGWTWTGHSTKEVTVTIDKGSMDEYSFTANYEKTKYTLTYDLKDGTVSTANPDSYYIDTETFTLNNPSKDGSIFSGWTWDGEATPQTSVTIGKGSTGNRAFTANYTYTPYSITYHLDGGTVLADNPATYNAGTETFTLNNPSKTGYTFNGWTGTDLTDKTKTVTIEKGSTGDREFTANFTKDIYTITYTLNDGTVTTANPATYDVDTETFTLNNPSKTGYTFNGWTWDGEATPQTSVTIDKGSTGNRTFTANFTKDTYTITYTLNDGTVLADNPASYDVDSETFTLNNPSKTGYTFDGWTGTNLTDKTKTVTIDKGSTGNRTFTANFTKDIYTITCTLNGGTVTIANPATYDVDTEEFTLNNPSRTGYTFDGWTGTDLTDKTKTVTIEKGSTGNKEFTANFTKDTYTITYNLDSGTVNGTNLDSYDVDTETFTLINPDKTGYAFDGWTWDGHAVPVQTVTIEKGSTGNRIFTANYTKGAYKITYDLDGGDLLAANKGAYDVDTDSFTLNNPSKTGYTFTGWTGTDLTDKTETVIIEKGSTGNRTYKANYSPINYTITYELNGGEVQTDNKTSYNIETESFTLSNPVKKGYTFTGWTGTGLLDKTENVTIEKGSTGDKSFVASFEKATYTITYDLDSGNAKGSNPDTYQVDTDTFTLTNPERTGYTFFGWTWEGHATPSIDAEIEKGTAGNLTVKANWIANNNTPYVVNHYKINEDKTTYSLADTENKEGITDSTLNLSSLQKSYDGFTFEGGKAENATEIKPASFDTQTTILPDGTRVINLYYKIRERSSGGGGGGGGASTPKASADAKISTGDKKLDEILSKNNEEELKKIKVEDGKIVSLPENLVWEGHNFDGWYKDKDFKEKVKIGDIIEGKLTLYAKFSEANEEGSFKAYMNGYEDKTFKPKELITREEVATIMARLYDEFDEKEDYKMRSDFEDAKDRWSLNYIGFCRGKNVINGYEDGSFHPTSSMTRAELATLVNKALEDFINLDEITRMSNITFTDVKGKWYEESVMRLASLEILNGYEDGSFKGDNYVTRIEVAIVMNKLTGRVLEEPIKDEYIKKVTDSFKDVDKNSWYFKYVVASTCDLN